MLARHTVYFSGRVQGVGFRATTAYLARRFAVTGFVRNLPDGRVELVAEGDAAELERFREEIRAHFARQLTGVQTSAGPADGSFQRFEVQS